MKNRKLYIILVFLSLLFSGYGQLNFIEIYQNYAPEKYRDVADVCDSTIVNSPPNSVEKSEAKALRYLIIWESDARNSLTRIKSILEKQNESFVDSSIVNIQDRAARILMESGKYEETDRLYKEILRFIPEEEKAEKARFLRKQGNLYRRMGQIKRAIEKYYEAIHTLDQAPEDDKKLRGFIHLNLGILYKNQRDYSTALEEYANAEKLFLEIEDENSLAQTYNNRGIVYKWLKEYDKSDLEYRKCIMIWSKLNDFKNMAKTYQNLGVLYFNKGNYEEAIHHAQKSLSIRKENGWNIGLFSNYHLIAQSYLKQRNLKGFNTYFDLCKEQFEQHNIVSNQYEFLDLAIARDSIKGDFYGAFNKTRLRDELKDSLYSTELLDFLNKERIKYQQNLEIEANENKKKLKEAKEDLESKNEREQKIIRWGVTIFLILVLAFCVLLFYRFVEARRSKVKLEKANKELKETLISKEEKEVLLQEIHHRVKNNLQIIMSLLRLQKHQIQDERVLELYAESENRIRSMALVHEELYGNKDFAKVNVKEYLEKLLNNLIQNYSVTHKVNSFINIEVEHFNIDTLVPLGLLCNELISNALKHGLKTIAEPEIRIEIKNNPEAPKLFTLEFSDNGQGVQSKSDLEKDNSIGMDLVFSLVDQMDGTFEVDIQPPGLSYQFQLTKQN